MLLRSLHCQDKRVAKLQAEEAAKRAAKQAEEEERRKQEREARLAAAAQYQEADWITASEAARAQEVGQGVWLDGRKVGGSAKASRATFRRGNDCQHSVQRAGTGLPSGIARRIWGLFDGAISVRCWLRLIARAAVRGQDMQAAVQLLRSLHLLCGQFQRPPCLQAGRGGGRGGGAGGLLLCRLRQELQEREAAAQS